jgi:hypothetical protein
MVEGEHFSCAVPLGEHDDGGFGHAERLVAVAVDHALGGLEIGGAEGREFVGAPSEFREHREFGVDANPGRDEVVEFGDDVRRNHQWFTRVLDDSLDDRMGRLGAVEEGE